MIQTRSSLARDRHESYWVIATPCSAATRSSNAALAYGPLTIAATDSINAKEQGLAGGILYTSWQFGSALGLAAVTAIKLTEVDQTSLDGFHAALFVPVVAVILSTVVIAFGLRGRRLPEAQSGEFVTASD